MSLKSNPFILIQKFLEKEIKEVFPLWIISPTEHLEEEQFLLKFNFFWAFLDQRLFKESTFGKQFRCFSHPDLLVFSSNNPLNASNLALYKSFFSLSSLHLPFKIVLFTHEQAFGKLGQEYLLKYLEDQKNPVIHLILNPSLARFKETLLSRGMSWDCSFENETPQFQHKIEDLRNQQEFLEEETLVKEILSYSKKSPLTEKEFSFILNIFQEWYKAIDYNIPSALRRHLWQEVLELLEARGMKKIQEKEKSHVIDYPL